METYLVSLVSAYQADSRHPQAALGNRSAAYSQQYKTVRRAGITLFRMLRIR